MTPSEELALAEQSQPIHHEPTSFLRRHVFSVDHKVIAKQFLWAGLVFMAVGGLLAMQMRWHSATPPHPTSSNATRARPIRLPSGHSHANGSGLSCGVGKIARPPMNRSISPPWNVVARLQPQTKSTD